MRRNHRTFAALAAGLPLYAATISAVQAAPVVFTSAGPNVAAVQPFVNDFRNALGTLNPNQAGSFGSGRREINWEGVPAQSLSPNGFPGDFFNVNSPRGLVTTTPGAGTSQQVSNNAGNPGFEFDDLNAGYPAEFIPFSGQKLFTPVGTNLTDVLFFVPGSTTPATTSAFGAVFSDVDLAGETTLSFFRQDGSSLGTFQAPVADKGLSFLGVQFTGADEEIFRVRIKTGNANVGARDFPGDLSDVVVMDDFLYAEPRAVVGAAVPEPGTLALAALPLLGMLGAATRRRRRNRG